MEFQSASPLPIFETSLRFDAARSRESTVRAVTRVSEGIKTALFEKIRELKAKQNEIEQVSTELLNEKKAKYIN